MSLFTAVEVTYLQEQRLGRLATVSRTGNPHVVPVNFFYNPDFESIDIVGRGLSTSLKYQNIVNNGRVAFIVDDIVSLAPYRARMIEIRGHAEIVQRSENDPLPRAPEMTPEMIRMRASAISPEMIRIRAKRIIAIGLFKDPTIKISRSVQNDGSVRETRTSIGPKAEERELR